MSRNKRPKIDHLYIHIPFCRNKCPYCDFFSLPFMPQKIKDRYTDALITELDSVSNMIARPLKSIYLGGGSPILVGKKNLKKLLQAVAPFSSERTETSIELNPEHVESLKISDLKFNRISLGVQTTNKRILTLIKRSYSLPKLLNNIARIKSSGVGVSLDLMFALPTQTINDLKKDIGFVKRTRPDHVSFYMFTPPVNYELSYLLPDDQKIEKMFTLIHKTLEQLGYDHYEVSNYAKDKKGCVHNLSYWDRSSYLGLGAGAHSFISDKEQRMWHTKDLRAYIKDPVIYEGSEIIDEKAEKMEKIMLGLRLLHKGVPTTDVKNVKELIKAGFVDVKNKRVKIRPDKLILLDSTIEHICKASLS